MASKNILLFSLLFVIAVSCSRKRENNAINIVDSIQTPKVLDDDKSDISVGSIYKRDTYDIIRDLYDEAVKKDAGLENLDSRIEKIAEMKKDSMEAYNKYVQNNYAYWSGAQNYINRISDTALRQETKKIFETLEEGYKSRIAGHKAAESTLNYSAELLNDRYILLKLFVTLQMIKNYEKNELPDLNTIKELTQKYDTLISETKSYTKRHRK